MNEKFFCAVTIALCTIGCKQYEKSIPISTPLFLIVNDSMVEFTGGIERLYSTTIDVLKRKNIEHMIVYHRFQALKREQNAQDPNISRGTSDSLLRLNNLAEHPYLYIPRNPCLNIK